MPGNTSFLRKKGGIPPIQVPVSGAVFPSVPCKARLRLSQSKRAAIAPLFAFTIVSNQKTAIPTLI